MNERLIVQPTAAVTYHVEEHHTVWFYIEVSVVVVFIHMVVLMMLICQFDIMSHGVWWLLFYLFVCLFVWNVIFYYDQCNKCNQYHKGSAHPCFMIRPLLPQLKYSYSLELEQSYANSWRWHQQQLKDDEFEF